MRNSKLRRYSVRVAILTMPMNVECKVEEDIQGIITDKINKGEFEIDTIDVDEFDFKEFVDTSEEL